MPIRLASKKAPVVEIDTVTGSAYIRFGHGKVTRTDPLPVRRGREIAHAEFTAGNALIGIEFIGVTEFTITELLKGIELGVPAERLAKARYVTSNSKAS